MKTRLALGLFRLASSAFVVACAFAFCSACTVYESPRVGYAHVYHHRYAHHDRFYRR
ncbi:MAG TPA: hypothetical protein VIF15_07495 [Polyangiaceae bacterium]